MTSLDIYVISLDPLRPTHPVLTFFPDAKRFPAVDRRTSTVDDVRDIVTGDAQLTLKRGRKWHHELSSLGAVGLYESHRNVLAAGENAVLIFEEDAVIGQRFVSALESLRSQMDDFDLAVFGPLKTESLRESIKLQGFCTTRGEFWGLHAVLYSKEGRKKVSTELSGLIDVQLDAKLSRLAMFGDVRLVVQCHGAPLATQAYHISTIQETEHSTCRLCNADPLRTQEPFSPDVIAYAFAIAFVIVSVMHFDQFDVTSFLVASSLLLLAAAAYRSVRSRTFHVVVVCTPNYDSIGAYGVNSLQKYCERHGYDFTLWRESVEGLHVSFTKNEAVLNTLRETTSDYVVCIDADVAVHDVNYALDNFIVDDAVVMYASRRRSPASQNSMISGAFDIWKTCHRSIELNRLWLTEAYNGCAKGRHPPQQSVFDLCVYPQMAARVIHFVDHNLVGLPHSKIIAKTKQGRRAWEAMGKPNGPIDVTSQKQTETLKV